MQHFWSTTTQGLHNSTFRLGRRASSSFGIVFSFFFLLHMTRFISQNFKLRHQRTTCCAAPMLQLDPLWIKLSGMFSLPVCTLMSGPSAETYKLMQYANMKAVLSEKDFVSERLNGLEATSCLCLVQPVLWLETAQIYFFSSPPFSHLSFWSMHSSAWWPCT